MAKPRQLPRLVGTAELSALWHVNRQRVHVITAARDFPAGERLGLGSVYAWDDVVEWSVQHGRPCYPVPGYPDPNPGPLPEPDTGPLWDDGTGGPA